MKDKEGQVIQYIDGLAWGVTPGGKTMGLGSKEEVKVLISKPKKTSTNPVVAGIISLERQLQKRQGKQERKELIKEEAKRTERREQAKSFGIELRQKPRNAKVKAKP